MDSKRTLAVHSLRFVGRLVGVGLIAAAAACDDVTEPPPPTPPPQITVTQTYSKGSTGLPSSDVYTMLTLSNGEFWIGTEQGIGRYASITATTRIVGSDGVYNELNGLPNPKVRDMAEFDGKVYVATWGGGLGIYDVAGGTWTSRTTADGLRDGAIADIEVSSTEGKVYLATNDAVSIYNPTLDNFSSFVDLTREVVSAVGLRDTPGGVERWYGPRVESVENPTPPKPTPGITVSRGASTVFRYTEVNSGLAEPDVTCIFYDGGSVFWVAFSTKGVAMVNVDESTWTTYTTLQGLPSNTVYSVTRANAPGGGSTIWAATQSGIARLEGNGKWQGYGSGGGLPSDRVREVYSDNGQNLWAGLVNGGAVRLNPVSAD